MTQKYLLVAPDPNRDQPAPGGQSTAAQSLYEIITGNGDQADFVDTYQSPLEPLSFMARLKRSYSRYKKLKAHIKANKSYEQVIIFTGCGISFLEKVVLGGYAKKKGLPVTMCMRDGGFILHCENSKLWRFLYRVLLPKFDRHVIQGGVFKDWYQRLGIESAKIDVILNWPRSHIKLVKQPLKATDPVKFIFVGWVVKEKGVAELLEAIAGSDVLRQCEVAILGDGYYREEAQTFATNNGLDKVFFKGNLKHPEVIESMKQSNVLVLPTYFEGFPNVIVEAFYCGLPVIATNVGAISESIDNGENGYLVEVKSAVSLREAMEKIAVNPEAVAGMSQKALKTAALKHDEKTNSHKMLSLGN